MSARRQSSTTSLSKFARINSPILQNRSLDFCNSFWGFGDGGVDVLFARMRGASRTMEELKSFWKERAAIEEDYAKRLAKLAKMTLGRDEIGELRSSLDTVRLETDRQAAFHLNLSQQFKAELEGPVASFHARQLQHKKAQQTIIEKEFKTKQTQESYVNKAREKYEQDCVRINSFTAQASLVQGKDLEKINLKLERTQQTVQTNEREFANFSKALQDTVQKWEQDWRGFCDTCQDLEEDRIDFMKDNLWAYANFVSTVCVADDEACEHIRVALEQLEPEKDMENFVRDYGTGSQIPDPPAFVNYQTPDAIPSSSARPTSRPATFIRSSNREPPVRQYSMPPEPDDAPIFNTAGIGAGGGAGSAGAGAGGSKRTDSYIQDNGGLSRQPTRSAATSSVYTNGTSSNSNHTMTSTSPATSVPSASPAVRRQSLGTPLAQQQQLQKVLQDPYAEAIDPNAETFIKVGNNAYKVDLNNDPQQQPATSSIRQNMSPIKQNGAVDPLMKQLEDLQNAVSTSGSVRRNTLHKPKASSVSAEPKPGPGHVSSSSTSSRSGASGGAGPSTLSPPTGGSALAGGLGAQQNRANSPRSVSPGRDYRNSAEMVVGAHPSVSRPVSPNPPTAAFMVPKSTSPAVAGDVVQEVLADYQQSLPGERKSISRSNSPVRGHAPSISQGSIHSPLQAPNASQGQNLARPSSQLGHAGVGAHGSRSNSPQPISRGPSPAPSQARSSFIQPPAQVGPGVARAPSPNTVGIALDPSGRVLHDEMAQRYQQQQAPPPQQQPVQMHHQQHRPGVPPQTQQPAYNPPPAPVQQMPPQQPVQQHQQQPAQRRASYVSMNSISAPVQQQAYAVTPPPPAMYHTPSPQPSYVQPPPVQPVYNPPPPPPVQYQPPPPQQQQQQQTRYSQPTPQANAYQNVNVNGVHRPSSGAYYGNQQVQPVHQQQPPPAQMLAVQQPLQQQQQRVVQQQQQRGYQQQPQQQQQQQHSPVQLAYRDASPGRSPSPQPPPQTTDGGDNVLFYVKALYDYTATIEEEFDFQAGDIIAVTATPEDGWWSGELLDEARRQKGRNVFPSNFVCLF